MSKKVYKPRNWSAYNKSKVKAGNIFLYFDDNISKCWYDSASQTGKGRSKTYSDQTIEAILLVRYLFQIPFRQTQGFTEGILSQMKLELSAPDYSTLSRRSKLLNIEYRHQDPSESLHISVDSSGVNIHKGSSWNAYKHRRKDNKKWLKIHLAVDPMTGEIMANSITDPCTSDRSQVSTLLSQLPDQLEGFYADGAYDRNQVYLALSNHQLMPINTIIPPIETSKLPEDPTIPLNQRHRHLEYLQTKGRNKWRNKFKYGRRESSEGVFARLKMTFGENLLSRDSCAQQSELNIKCKYLNQANKLYSDGFV